MKNSAASLNFENPVAFRIAAGLGLLLVGIGAFGAHVLQPVLEAHDTLAIWQTGVFYHAIHAVALLALAACARANFWTTLLWCVGILIFSGSLYTLSITNLRWLGAITPMGGVALIAGWLVLLIRGR